MQKKENTYNRITGLDLYRIIACLMVFINHNSSKVMAQVPDKSLAWFVTVAVVYITKIAVPGFFMISGYNLLHKQDNWLKTWSRIRRILVDLLVFSLVYYVWKCSIGIIVINTGDNVFVNVWSYIWGFVSIVWTSPMTEAYWYLYTYLGVLIILPFLQKMVANMDIRDLKIILTLSLVFVSVLPILYIFFPGMKMAGDFSIPVISATYGSVMYMLIGHCFYLHESGDFAFKMPSWVLGLGIAIGFVLNMGLSMVEYEQTAGESFLSMSHIEYLPLAMESICLLALLIRINYPGKIIRMVQVLAPCTFGVYLITDLVCSNTHLIYYYTCPYMNRLFAVAVQDVAAILIAFIFIYLIRLLPVVKKWI